MYGGFDYGDRTLSPFFLLKIKQGIEIEKFRSQNFHSPLKMVAGHSRKDPARAEWKQRHNREKKDENKTFFKNAFSRKQRKFRRDASARIIPLFIITLYKEMVTEHTIPTHLKPNKQNSKENIRYHQQNQTSRNDTKAAGDPPRLRCRFSGFLMTPVYNIFRA